jgi:hypothetical protein
MAAEFRPSHDAFICFDRTAAVHCQQIWCQFLNVQSDSIYDMIVPPTPALTARRASIQAHFPAQGGRDAGLADQTASDYWRVRARGCRCSALHRDQLEPEGSVLHIGAEGAMADGSSLRALTQPQQRAVRAYRSMIRRRVSRVRHNILYG